MKSNKNSISVIFRIIKDSLPIAHWLTLATLLSIGSAYMSMSAPEILGTLTNSIYAFLNDGVLIDRGIFTRDIVKLAIVYVLSAAFGALTTAIMNYSVTSFFTCRIRVRMSEKIATVPIKTVDNTPNGEIISRMTHDGSIMGGSVHDIGDVNGDGIIEYNDVMMAYKAFLGKVELTPEQMAVVDTNQNGIVEEAEYQAIYQIYIGG